MDGNAVSNDAEELGKEKMMREVRKAVMDVAMVRH